MFNYNLILLREELQNGNVGARWLKYVTGRNFTKLSMNRNSCVIQRRSLTYDSKSSTNACQGKHPEKKPIQHHGNEFPILDNLKVQVTELFLMITKSIERKLTLQRFLYRIYSRRSFYCMIYNLNRSSFYLIILIGFSDVLCNKPNTLQGRKNVGG